MSYCVNCGVELERSATQCPLCNTPVINPRILEQKAQERPASFPKNKGEVETVNRKDVGILLSVVFLTTAVTCGILNLLVFQKSSWSLAVIGVCAILWVMLLPAVLITKQPVYVSIFLDGVIVSVFLYLLTFLTHGSNWFWGLGFPIVGLLTLLTESIALCFRVLPKSFLTRALYIFTYIGLLCGGLEMLIIRYLDKPVRLTWSAVVMTVVAILDITIATTLSKRRFREAVRRRLHF